jgi:hypothetical protein
MHIGLGVNSEWIDNQRVGVIRGEHKWVIVFLPYSIESLNFAGFVCELLCNSFPMFNNDECSRVYTYMPSLCLNQT